MMGEQVDTTLPLPAVDLPTGHHLPSRSRPYLQLIWRHDTTYPQVITDPQGSTVAELRKSGQVTGHLGTSCGVLDGFDFHMLRSAAAYIMIIDPGFVEGK